MIERGANLPSDQRHVFEQALDKIENKFLKVEKKKSKVEDGDKEYESIDEYDCENAADFAAKMGNRYLQKADRENFKLRKVLKKVSALEGKMSKSIKRNLL